MCVPLSRGLKTITVGGQRRPHTHPHTRNAKEKEQQQLIQSFIDLLCGLREIEKNRFTSEKYV